MKLTTKQVEAIQPYSPLYRNLRADWLAMRKMLEKAAEALGDLIAEQNGPPLFKYEKQWNKAVKKANQVDRELEELLG
jgi:hypothetical protein